MLVGSVKKHSKKFGFGDDFWGYDANLVYKNQCELV